jgi:hypothetical protein
MELPEEQDDVREQLYEALSATCVKEKDFHVRQAIQLLQLED